MIRPLLTAGLLFATFPICAATEVRFLAERYPQDLGAVRMVSGEEQSEAFDLPTKHLSEPRFAPQRTFRIRTVLKDKALATVELPAGGDSFIVLLVPAVKGGFKPVVLPSDRDRFQAGEVYCYNHSPNLVFGKVGSAKLALQPSSGGILKPAGARKENFYDVLFYYRSDKGDRPLSSTRWPVDGKVRSYAFFYVHPESGRPAFRTVDEFLPPLTPATAR